MARTRRQGEKNWGLCRFFLLEMKTRVKARLAKGVKTGEKNGWCPEELEATRTLQGDDEDFSVSFKSGDVHLRCLHLFLLSSSLDAFCFCFFVLEMVCFLVEGRVCVWG